MSSIKADLVRLNILYLHRNIEVKLRLLKRTTERETLSSPQLKKIQEYRASVSGTFPYTFPFTLS